MSQNKKYTALLRLAVLSIMSEACCLVSFLFWLTITPLKLRFQTACT
ncbi:hypothetical protein HMPREF9120_01464 [Neisseria sp. oral taxon 020 str. F0370]|nr:hypothetical protein HMPREF9120_01464 [Neisseria sp. oral taxon 020 str. F0370]